MSTLFDIFFLIGAASTRLDFGLGNPNKAAALFVSLVPILWGVLGFALRRRGSKVRDVGFIVGLLLTGGVGVPLLLTESRGGVLAALVALGVLSVFSRRPWAMWRVAAVAVMLCATVFLAAQIGVTRRMSPDYLTGDDSIQNRLRIWSSAPAMIADASGGWGAGRAGPEYGQWYQPPAISQKYRVLVSSHLTSLVEASRTGRFAYVALWGFVLFVSWRAARRSAKEPVSSMWQAAPLALAASQFVAWQFSDVAELLVVRWSPALALLAAMGIVAWGEKKKAFPPVLSDALLAVCVAFVLNAGLEWGGWRKEWHKEK